MVGKTAQHHHAASSSLVPEETNLLQKAREGSPDSGGNGSGRRGHAALQLGRQWKCMLLGSLGTLGLGGLGRRRGRPRCVVCLQVQHVSGLPSSVEGRGVVVGWRSTGGQGERTAPARVARGAASFDEVFLQYFSAGGATLRGFTVWAALMDNDTASGGGCGAGDDDLGAFPVDLTEATAAECSNPKFGGKALSFPLGGEAAGGVLAVSVYCRVMEQEEIHGAHNNGLARERKNKGKISSYAACLPDLGCLRNRPTAAPAAAAAAAAATSSGSTRRATSLRSDRGGLGAFITIENSVAEMEDAASGNAGAGVEEEDDEEEVAGFITIEKGTISSRSRRAALLLEVPEEDEKPCLFMELSGPGGAGAGFDVEEVEDEFLAMLEDNRYWMETRSKEIEKGLNVGMDMGLDLDLLIRDAEMELARAEQAWKSKVGAAIVEEEEYKELVRRWGGGINVPSSNSACSWAFGFGSPI